MRGYKFATFGRMQFFKRYKANCRYHGYLSPTAITELEKFGNRVEFVNGAWWLNRQPGACL
jgi:hypothetical protein